MDNFIKENWQAVGGLVGMVATFFGGQRLKKSNVKSAELENLAAVREMEKQLIDDYREQLNEFRKLIDDMQIFINEKDVIIKAQKVKIAGQKKQLLKYEAN